MLSQQASQVVLCQLSEVHVRPTRQLGGKTIAQNAGIPQLHAGHRRQWTPDC